MGRRKIDIKKIKDERNRSVTFLKRKGGLFKKAYELSVLCDVQVAVVIFGSTNKLHQFSSCDMRKMMHLWSTHGEPNEHKTPADFNGRADDEEDEDDDNGTPPQGDAMDPHMLPPQFQSHSTFPMIRHHTPSASPPIANGVFVGRGHTPQPQMGSRPSSRNDIRRMGPGMMGQPVGPPGPQPGNVNGFTFMPQQPMYNAQPPHSMPPNMQPNMALNMPHGLPQNHPQFPYPQPQPQQFVDEQRRASGPSAFPMQPSQGPQAVRHSASPPQPPATQLPSQLPPQPYPHMSPPTQPQGHPMQSPPQPQQHLPPPPPPQPQEVPQAFPAPLEPQPPAATESKPKPDLVERPRQSLLLDTNIKKLAPRKGGSIFTPIEENRSVLSQHLAAFHHPEPKQEAPSNRSQSMDVGSVTRSGITTSPPSLPRLNTQIPQVQIKRNGSMGNIPETTFTPPSRSNSLRTAGSISRPRLKVQIPDESDGGSATNESASPHGGNTTTATDVTSQPSRRTASHSSGMVLPQPSPSHPTTPLPSAGAVGPPNPFARPGPSSSETPISAIGRYGDFFAPSPSGFHSEFFKGNEITTLSPIVWNTPVVGQGPSFLSNDLPSLKRKSPDFSSNGVGVNGSGNGNGGQQGQQQEQQQGEEKEVAGGETKRPRLE